MNAQKSKLGVDTSYFKVIIKQTHGLSSDEFFALESRKVYIIIDGASANWMHFLIGIKNAAKEGCFLSFDYGNSQQLILKVWNNVGVYHAYTVNLTSI